MTAIGLIVLSLAVTVTERSARMDQEVEELSMVIDVAQRLMARDERALLEALNDTSGVRLTVIDSSGTPSAGERPAVDAAELEELISRSEGGEDADAEMAVTSDSSNVLVVARTLSSGSSVLAWIPTADIPAPDPLLTGMVWGISALLLFILTVTTVFLVDRSLRPASFALVRQGRFIDDAGQALHRPLDEIKENLERSLVSIKPTSGIRHSIQAVDHAGSAVDDLLTLFRLDAMSASGSPVEKRPLRLDTLVASVVPDDVGFASAGPSEIIGDESLIRRAVSHMIENAKVHGDGPVEVTLVGRTITVLDRGPGFGADAHKMFARFQAGGAHPGLGLGLALVAATARVHRGTVSAENRPDGGGKVVLGLG